MSERSIFLAALDIADSKERAAYLHHACAGDPALRQHLEDLIAAQQKLGSFLDRPHIDVEATSDVAPIAERPGSQIGPYKLLQVIGEGGMGVVYMAEQMQPIHRRVALKIIKPGMDSQQVIARFEAERQALAMMDHLNIAKILDAGVVGPGRRTGPDAQSDVAIQSPAGPSGPTGRPYFVMELVHGIPITKYCDDNHLSPRQRLDLFIPVCQAIQHAHQKGIIHRDIKPTNVLVCLYDGKPVPKVIDFGVAKAIEQRLTERTLFTQFGNIIGTFEYMSPEQAEMSQLGTDTRSDIYSLGVLLYELLTGTTPLDRTRLRTAALDEMLRMIREEEPPKPSTRISSLSRVRETHHPSRAGSAHQTPLPPEEGGQRPADGASSLASIAALRQTEPAKLARLVRGDLDWIVMKCLEKDRTRRYETANGLARDISRYLSDEPVEACPPSTAYRLKKLIRRNKGPALAASLLLLTLLIGIAGTTWGLIRAESSRQAEATQRAQADDARQKAETAKGVAESERTRAVTAEQLAQETAKENKRLSDTREQARQATARKLFDALISESRSLKLARQPGYRSHVWANLKQAAALDFPGKDLSVVREVAVETLGDPVGLDPMEAPEFEPVPKPPVSEVFSKLIAIHASNAIASSGTRYHAVDREGRWLAVAYGGRVILWNAEGKETARKDLPRQEYAGTTGLLFTGDGKHLLIAEPAGLLVWSVPDLSPIYLARGDRIVHLAASPDQRTFATLNQANRVELFDVDSSKAIASFAAPPGAGRIEFNQDGTMLVALAKNKPLRGWHVARTPEKRRLAGIDGAYRVRFSPDNRHLAATAFPISPLVAMWNSAAENTVLPERTYGGQSGGSTAIAFHPSGQLMATSDSLRIVHVWDCASGRQLATANSLEGIFLGSSVSPPGVAQLAFACQGELLVGAGEHGLHVWRLSKEDDNLRLTLVLKILTASARALAIHPHGTQLVFGISHDNVYTYDLRTGTGPTKLPVPFASEPSQGGLRGRAPALEALHFDHSGRHLIFASQGGQAGVWDWHDARITKTTNSTFSQIAFAISPAGKWLAGIRPANRAVVVDLESNREIYALPEESSAIVSMDWTRDGKSLALGCTDGVVIWDLEEVRRQLADLGIDMPSTKSGAPSLIEQFPSIGSDELAKIISINQAVNGAERNLYLVWENFHQWEGWIRTPEFAAAVAQLFDNGKLQPDHWDRFVAALRIELRQLPKDKLADYEGKVYQLLSALDKCQKYGELARLRELQRDHYEATQGPSADATLVALDQLAGVYEGVARWDDAIAVRIQARDRTEAVHGAYSRPAFTRVVNLSNTYLKAGQVKGAIENYERAIEGQKAASAKEDDPIVLETWSRLAAAYKQAGDLAKAVSIARRTLGPAHSTTVNYTLSWAAALDEAGDYDKSAATLKELLAAERSQFPANDPRLANVLASLAKTLVTARQFAEAEPFAKECLTIRQQSQPDLWPTFNAKSLLGGSLLGQQKYADAEPLLLAGYKGLKQREAKIPASSRPARLTEALQRLIDLYTAWDKPEDAAKWQKSLAEHSAAAKRPAESPPQLQP